jgi:hypothetical protein
MQKKKLCLKNFLRFKKNKKTQHTAVTTMTQKLNIGNGLQERRTEGQLRTAPTQKAGFRAPKTVL